MVQFIKIREHVLSLVSETLLTSWELIRITIPVAIITKMLQEFGLIAHFAQVLEPVMGLIGLPGSLGLVWATAMATNLYGGIAVFAAIAPNVDLTSAQVTVLCASMLFAHSLPIELSVSKRAGAALLPIGLLRVGTAIVFGYLLNAFCLQFGMWQEQATMLFQPSAAVGGLASWAITLLRNQGLIILIIFCIVVCMRIFRALGVLALLERILVPVLPHFGMSPKAAPITVVGMIMGIGYGGALIVRETAKGEISKREVFNAMVLMGLCHGLVEDTLIMLAIGGKIGGIFWARICFSLLVTYCLIRLLQSFNTAKPAPQVEKL